MHHTLATQLALDSTTVTKEYSPAIDMNGFDAAQIDAVLLRLTATNVLISIQESNDRENFRTISGTTETLSAEGYKLGTKRTGIGARYIRLAYELTGTGIGIVAAGVNLSKQG